MILIQCPTIKICQECKNANANKYLAFWKQNSNNKPTNNKQTNHKAPLELENKRKTNKNSLVGGKGTVHQNLISMKNNRKIQKEQNI